MALDGYYRQDDKEVNHGAVVHTGSGQANTAVPWDQGEPVRSSNQVAAVPVKTISKKSDSSAKAGRSPLPFSTETVAAVLLLVALGLAIAALRGSLPAGSIDSLLAPLPPPPDIVAIPDGELYKPLMALLTGPIGVIVSIGMLFGGAMNALRGQPVVAIPQMIGGAAILKAEHFLAPLLGSGTVPVEHQSSIAVISGRCADVLQVWQPQKGLLLAAFLIYIFCRALREFPKIKRHLASDAGKTG